MPEGPLGGFSTCNISEHEFLRTNGISSSSQQELLEGAPSSGIESDNDGCEGVDGLARLDIQAVILRLMGTGLVDWPVALPLLVGARVKVGASSVAAASAEVVAVCVQAGTH